MQQFEGFYLQILQMNAFAVISDSGTPREENPFLTSVRKPFPDIYVRISTERL